MLVEIWSDVMCPWCYVGKRNFEVALQGFEHAGEVEVRWRSFELDPSAPLERDGEYAQMLAQKYGTDVAGAEHMLERMTGVAAEAGLEFRFDRARPANSFDAHRLLHLAGERGLQDELKERLFAAYLTEGELVSDHSVLKRLAVEVGLDESEVEGVLSSGRYASDVRSDEATAAAYRVSGVPFYVFAGTYGVSGAQPPEVLREVLREAWKAQKPDLVMVGEAASSAPGCDDGSCST